MRAKSIRRWNVISAVVSAVVALVSAFSIYGTRARAVDIVTIFAAGVGTGASLVSIFRAWRSRGASARS